jgi:hypothetical protein
MEESFAAAIEEIQGTVAVLASYLCAQMVKAGVFGLEAMIADLQALAARQESEGYVLAAETIRLAAVPLKGARPWVVINGSRDSGRHAQARDVDHKNPTGE